jgi:hypothetical protein
LQTCKALNENCFEPSFKLLKDSEEEHFEEVLTKQCVPALRLMYSLMAASDAFWKEFVETKRIDKLVKRTEKLKDYPALISIRTQIALLHVDRVASTCLDPASVPGCLDIVQRLKDLQNLSDFSSNGATSVLNHLSVISRLADVKQIQGISKYIIDLLKSEHEDEKLSIFSTASFLEVDAIRDQFFRTWYNSVLECLESFISFKASNEKEVLACLKGLDTRKIDETTQKLQTTLRGTDLRIKQKKKSDMRPLLNLIKGLSLLPIYFFNLMERRAILLVLVALKLSLTGIDARIEFEGICQTLMLEQLSDSQDLLTVFKTPDLLVNCINQSFSKRSDASLLTGELKSVSAELFGKIVKRSLHRTNPKPFITSVLEIEQLKDEKEFLLVFTETVNAFGKARKGLASIDNKDLSQAMNLIEAYYKRIMTVFQSSSSLSPESMKIMSSLCQFYQLRANHGQTQACLSILRTRPLKDTDFEEQNILFDTLCNCFEEIRLSKNFSEVLEMGWSLCVSSGLQMDTLQNLLKFMNGEEQLYFAEWYITKTNATLRSQKQDEFKACIHILDLVLTVDEVSGKC